MADGKECWDCFFCGKSYGRNYKGEFEYECKRTHRTTKGDSTCSYFIADTSDVKSCSDLLLISTAVNAIKEFSD